MILPTVLRAYPTWQAWLSALLLANSALSTEASEDRTRLIQAFAEAEKEAESNFQRTREGLVEIFRKMCKKPGSGCNLSEPQFTQTVDELSALSTYQSAYNVVTCAEGVVRDPSLAVEQVKQATYRCVDSRGSAMVAYMKMVPIVVQQDPERLSHCDFQNRLFREEVIFPPYEFLRQFSHDLPLYDYEKLIICLQVK